MIDIATFRPSTPRSTASQRSSCCPATSCIRSGRRELHKKCMLGALTASALFLTSYVIYHANTGSRPFEGQGGIRVVYFAILITHVVLAASDPAAGARHGRSWLALAVRPSRPHRAMDAARLALRLGDRRRHLPDAVSALLRQKVSQKIQPADRCSRCFSGSATSLKIESRRRNRCDVCRSSPPR